MSRYSDKTKVIESKHGKLESVIPSLLKKHGGNQTSVAQELGLSAAFISRWLRRHGYIQVVQWVKRDKSA